MGSDVALLHPAAVERIEVVERDHGVAVAQQAIDEVAPDEARSAGDQQPHAPGLTGSSVRAEARLSPMCARK